MLDPVLADLVHALVEAFLAYCINSRDVYRQNAQIQTNHIEPLPRAICRLLYVFCKVRGHKVIVRLLNNEPKYIEPLLVCFMQWKHSSVSSPSTVSWEERYIMLLWLSHLLLAPFELNTISGFGSSNASMVEPFSSMPLPEVAKLLLAVALDFLFAASKERESASLLIVRLALRKDMQAFGLPHAAFHWCTNELKANHQNALAHQYRHVGLLTLLFGLTNSSSSTEAAPFVQHIFDTCKELATGTSVESLAARQSAPARKLLVKIMRSSMLHTLALANSGLQEAAEQAESMLESGIQILLEWLADSDTPVRQAASKALGMIIHKLAHDMAAEVVEAVLACLDENMLLEDRRTGQLTAMTDLFSVDTKLYKKNLNAVDALKWHGAMLTLGHILFRRSPPPEQLSSILDALLTGLAFEQRSNVGTSLGVGVRDAACFGIWSLARKYTTQEVEAASLSLLLFSSLAIEGHKMRSTLQVIATELVLASCLDPSGNLRRGASAALQELIGRHPDKIHEGISVVQRVDYHAVARRSRAMTEVSVAVSQLGTEYHASLLFSMLGWRGCRAVDSESRRQAASTIGVLFRQARPETQDAFARELRSQILYLKASNVGINAATRHGLLCSLAAILQSLGTGQGGERAYLAVLSPLLDALDQTTGTLHGRVTGDLTNVLEATAKLIAAASRNPSGLESSAKWSSFSSTVLPILDRCTTASEDDLLSATAGQANLDIFTTLDISSKVALIESWLPAECPQQKTVYTCKGRITSLASVYPALGADIPLGPFSEKITAFLASIVASSLAIEIKINAVEGIATILRSSRSSIPACMQNLLQAVLVGLADYTVDQRGDIGSLLRTASIDAVQSLQLDSLDIATVRSVLRLVVRLSLDKLSKVRFAAWMCLQRHWKRYVPEGQSLVLFEHQADISSFAYYRQLMELLKVDWLFDDTLLGLVGSIAGGADDISQIASGALISLFAEQNEFDRRGLLKDVVYFLVRQLKMAANQEDREVVPLLDVLCLVRENFIEDTNSVLQHEDLDILSLFDSLQTPVADIPRISSLIRLLSTLSSISQFRDKSVDRISRKLLHRWPRVRQAAVDAVFMLNPGAVPLELDWNLPPLNNKAGVVGLRKSLGVGGRTAEANTRRCADG